MNRHFNGNAKKYPYIAPVRSIRQLDSIPAEHRKLLLDVWKIDTNSELVNEDVAKWALSRTEINSLSNTHDENDGWMRLLANTAKGPKIDGEHSYATASVCTWGTEKKDEENIKKLITLLKETPEIAISAVSNFPYGTLSPDRAARSIVRIGEWLESYKGQKGFDSVLNYKAWLDGDVEKVRETLIAESNAASYAGLTLTVIQKATAHILQKESFFDSLYGSTMLSLEEGADCVGTSTGKAANKPYSDDVSTDISTPETMLPMLLALNEFNKSNDANRQAKLSNGFASVIDAARVKYMVEAILGVDALDTVTIGGSYALPCNLRSFIKEQEGDKTQLSRKDCIPISNKKIELPNNLSGL